MAVSTSNSSTLGLITNTSSGGGDNGGGNNVEVDTTSTLGNIPYSLSGTNLTIDQSTVKYYGFPTLLKKGKYTNIEIPFTNLVVDSNGGYIYTVILDQNFNTISHKRNFIGVSTFNSNNGSLVSQHTEFEITESNIYYTVIGFRGWSQSRKINLFKNNLTHSAADVWISTGGVLDTFDTSGVNFNTITKTNSNEVIRGLIY